MLRNHEAIPRIDVTGLLRGPIRNLLTPFEPVIQKALGVDELTAYFQSALDDPGLSPFQTLLNQLRVEYQVTAEDLGRIPASGAAVAVANHPFGFLEGAILAATLPRVRDDFKIVANSLLAAIPEVRERFIFVNPFGGREAVRENRRPLRECFEWLRGGGMLVIFPAGEVAHLNWRERAVADPAWNPNVARLIRHSRSAAVPLYFHGGNSLSFHVAGAVHPALRTASLPRELLNKRGKTVELRIGRAVAARTMAAFCDDRQAIEYLRCRTCLLGARGNRAQWRFSLPGPRRAPQRSAEPVPAAVPVEAMAEEVSRLPAITQMEDLSVYLARAREIPHVLSEIGRLREATFRRVGEGTGTPVDLDYFDARYLHLFVWNEKKQELVGAYRVGPTPEIVPRYGAAGLYTSTLFRYHPALFSRMGPGIELGRSFIRPEYQRKYAPLLLLWKGIARYAASRPECPILFGAVSISDQYSGASRELLVSYLESRKDPELARLVTPRRPFRHEPGWRWQARALARFVRDVEELGEPIADLEADGKGVPILVRQYLKMGGKVLGCNVDAGFSNVVDALILVDLRETPPALLERYMSKDGLAGFRRYHGLA